MTTNTETTVGVRMTARDLLRLPIASDSPWLIAQVAGGTRLTLASGETATVLAVIDDTWRYPHPPTRPGAHVLVTLRLDERTTRETGRLCAALGARNVAPRRPMHGRPVVTADLPGDFPIDVTHAMRHTCGAALASPCQVDDWRGGPCTAARHTSPVPTRIDR